MPIPTEPIGSIPRPKSLIEGVRAFEAGQISRKALDALYSEYSGSQNRTHFDLTGEQK